MRILIAEDDFASRKLLLKFMSEYGECDVTVDGMEAIDAYLMSLEEKEPYDLICLDVMMPVMDGLTAARTIRDLERQDAKIIPIIAMTANVFREDAEKCMEAGMNAHLAKPLDAEKIKQTISEELRKQNACHK